MAEIGLAVRAPVQVRGATSVGGRERRRGCRRQVVHRANAHPTATFVEERGDERLVDGIVHHDPLRCVFAVVPTTLLAAETNPGVPVAPSPQVAAPALASPPLSQFGLATT